MTSANQEPAAGCTFIDDQGTFELENPHLTSYLYFPLVNEAGMMAAVTPTLNGDAKIGHDAFLTLPVSVEDLHNTRSARNFWVAVEGQAPWSATGNSARQIAQHHDRQADVVTLQAGLLWHRIIRRQATGGLQAQITSLVPASKHQVELMQVVLTNTGTTPLRLTATAAIPVYGRSADNLRDHRHVTSLLQRVYCHPYGVLVTPTLSFDERGHRHNATTYAVLGVEGDGSSPSGFFPAVEDFIGEGGTLDWPQAVVTGHPSPVDAGVAVDGYEALGGLRFREVLLQPGASQAYILMLAILPQGQGAAELVATYGSESLFQSWFDRTEAYWRGKLDRLVLHLPDVRFNRWVRWVAVQPTLRRLFGNSFLPYHDYGRGGRGWRDLWQDVLALLLMEQGDLGERLWGHFAGVRFDGSNATIIGARPGDFQADRNNIPRVWMDHGAWPWLTIHLYIDQTGDLGFLLREQTYFRDHLQDRAQKIDTQWDGEHGTSLLTAAGQPYSGTILEHLLVQHLVPFFNVGQHNNMRLEGADWNDGMDMAPNQGESVAFTALYASNLRQLSQLVPQLALLGIDQVQVAEELILLLDTLETGVDYASAAAKQARLAAFFASVRYVLSGNQRSIGLADLAADLAAKADWLHQHISANEWVSTRQGHGWFNGYYDDQGRRVEGEHPSGPRMTLTGQVFALMGDVASEEQAHQVLQAADHYLYDPKVGGYRLNTDFGAMLPDLGRCFGFAYGHKENGAMFSHMAVMYAYALYRRGLVQQGWQVLDGIFQHCQDFARSRMYPGIPEYVSARGRGMYPYLTGSASWYLLVLVTQVFGVRGQLGDLILQPKLLRSQFDPSGQASIETQFAGRMLRVVYHNPSGLDHGQYGVEAVKIDGQAVAFQRLHGSALLARDLVTGLASDRTHRVDLTLARP